MRTDTVVLVVAVLCYLGVLFSLVLRPVRSRPRTPLQFVRPPARGIFRMAGLWHCTHCGRTLEDGQSHLVGDGGWTCARANHPVSFRTPAAKGFERGHPA